MKTFNKLLIGFILFFGFFFTAGVVSVFAQTAVNTGDAFSGAVVTNCVNTNTVNSSGNPCSVINNSNSNPSPTPPPGEPTPPPGGGTNNNSNGGGGGGSSSSSCSDTKPVGSPIGLTAVAGPGPGQVTLSWLPPQGPFTTFQISYSDDSNTPKWGVPDTGNVLSYTVSGLAVNQYYFWVKAVNGCMPGDPAGPVSVGGIGGGEVLGAAVSPSPTPIKQVLGKSINEKIKVRACGSCIWWPIILGEIIALIIYFYLVFNKELGKKYLKRKFVWGLAIPIIAYIIFILINKDCLEQGFWWIIVDSASIFCKWFWLIDLAVYAVIGYGWKRYFAPKG